MVRGKIPDNFPTRMFNLEHPALVTTQSLGGRIVESGDIFHFIEFTHLFTHHHHHHHHHHHSLSRHCEVVSGGVSSGDVVIELSFDVRQKARGADAEEMRLRPLHAQLLLHQNQPRDGVFRDADASSWFKSHFVSGSELNGKMGFRFVRPELSYPGAMSLGQ